VALHLTKGSTPFHSMPSLFNKEGGLKTEKAFADYKCNKVSSKNNVGVSKTDSIVIALPYEEFNEVLDNSVGL
jgi:putative aminopeptidase FrvX